MTKNDLLQKIRAYDIDEASKGAIIALVPGEPEAEVSAETMDIVADAFQAQIDGKQADIDKLYDEAGVKLDENDPEYKAAFDTMITEVDQAESDFKTEVSALEEEAKSVVKDTEKQHADDLLKKIQSPQG